MFQLVKTYECELTIMGGKELENYDWLAHVEHCLSICDTGFPCLITPTCEFRVMYKPVIFIHVAV